MIIMKTKYILFVCVLILSQVSFSQKNTQSATIKKGVTVEQVAQVTRNFTESGIMVHAYLMYGYPTQTVQETVDSLEMVRQMFEIGILQSGFWHQFAMTARGTLYLSA